MIYEDYNRVPLIRLFERLKVYLHHKASVGIMQITSDHNLSDEESIIEAYNLLRYEIMQGDLEADDEILIEHYAYQYNPDNNYSKSVSFIYTHLYAYITKTPKYFRKFNLERRNVIESDTNLSPASQLTIGDLIQMTGLDKDDIYQKIKQENMTILLLEDEVNAIFDTHRTK